MRRERITDTLTLAKAIAARVREAGGRTYLVGGYVRDTLLGRVSKDIDIEVYGLTPAALRTLLGEFGEPYARGASFGVLGLRHSDIDIAMPRKETAIGGGHKDFDVIVDPFLPEEQAARRRDFTVNALYMDPLTGNVLDCFHGLEDLKNGVLRHVAEDSFPEDPLRVFRAARFAAVLGFTVAEATVRLCRKMELAALSRERVFEELSRTLQKAAHPSVFFTTLRQMGQLSPFFPEIEALIGALQNPRYPLEEDVFSHVLRVIDAGAALKDKARDPAAFMLACLFHDAGKSVPLVRDADGAVCGPGHGPAGVPVAERALNRLTNDRHLIAYTLDMVRRHMDPLLLFKRQAPEAESRALLDASVCPGDLLLLTRADGLGKVRPPLAGMDAFWEERYRDYTLWRSLPRVTGGDLIALGFRPGESMGALLKKTYQWSLEGIGREEALQRLRDERDVS